MTQAPALGRTFFEANGGNDEGQLTFDGGNNRGDDFVGARFAAEAAEVKVVAAAPVAAMLKQLGSEFERDTGHKLVTRFAPTPAVKREIDAGETFDLAISVTSAIDDLIKEGKIVGGTRRLSPSSAWA